MNYKRELIDTTVIFPTYDDLKEIWGLEGSKDNMAGEEPKVSHDVGLMSLPNSQRPMQVGDFNVPLRGGNV